jgi:TldD protein
MIKEIKHGYLLKGAKNGQLMQMVKEAHLVEKGEIKELMKGASVS